MNKEAVIWECCLPRLKKPPLDKEMADSVLKACCDVLKRHRMNYWISAGTLLGIYREGDFITGDIDIDVEVLANNKLDAVLNSIDELAPRYRNVWQKSDGKRIQAMWQFPEETLFDLYIFYPEDRGYVSYTPYSDQEIIYPRSMKKTTITFKGRTYPCWEPESYLRYVYGKDWRIPGGRKSVYGHETC